MISLIIKDIKTDEVGGFMLKINKSILSLVVIFVLGIICTYSFSYTRGYNICITNSTTKTIEKIELKYEDGTMIYNIAQIEPKKYWKNIINTNNIQGENAIILIYKDNTGNSYKEYIVGYLEKGYYGKVNINIKNMDENGKLDISIK